MRYQDKAKKIKVIERIAEEKPEIEKYVHSLHEASSKLLSALDKSHAEKQRLLAHVFINAYIAAEGMGVKDVTKMIEDRVKELMAEKMGK